MNDAAQVQKPSVVTEKIKLSTLDRLAKYRKAKTTWSEAIDSVLDQCEAKEVPPS